jgi:hypothetical protein
LESTEKDKGEILRFMMNLFKHHSSIILKFSSRKEVIRVLLPLTGIKPIQQTVIKLLQKIERDEEKDEPIISSGLKRAMNEILNDQRSVRSVGKLLPCMGASAIRYVLKSVASTSKKVDFMNQLSEGFSDCDWGKCAILFACLADVVFSEDAEKVDEAVQLWTKNRPYERGLFLVEQANAMGKEIYGLRAINFLETIPDASLSVILNQLDSGSRNASIEQFKEPSQPKEIEEAPSQEENAAKKPKLETPHSNKLLNFIRSVRNK